MCTDQKEQQQATVAKKKWLSQNMTALIKYIFRYNQKLSTKTRSLDRGVVKLSEY